MNLRKSAFICVLVLLAIPARAQEPQEDVLKIKSNLVNIDVIAKDKKGKYISDLKLEDFIVTENGLPQKIEFFDAPLSRKPGESVVGAPAAEIAPPRNYVSLVLDYQTTDITNLKQVREGAIKYVREQVTDADAVAVLSVSNSLQMLQPFTQDKAKLIAALEKAGVSANSKNFEQKDLSGNINSLRDSLNAAAPPSNITSPAGGSESARVTIMQRVLQQFIKLRTALSFNSRVRFSLRSRRLLKDSDRYRVKKQSYFSPRDSSRRQCSIGKCRARSTLLTVRTSRSILSTPLDFGPPHRQQARSFQLHHSAAFRPLRIRSNESRRLAARMCSTTCDRKGRAVNTIFCIGFRATPAASFSKVTTI